jgi:hypothetical protein
MQYELPIEFKDNLWYIQDSKRGLLNEPLVYRTSEIITRLKNQNQWEQSSLILIISDKKFSSSQGSAELIEIRSDGYCRYLNRKYGLSGWIADQMLHYYRKPPKILYFSLTRKV